VYFATSLDNEIMGSVWDATKLMLVIYGLGAVVSFLVAWVIKLTFIAIRLHGTRNATLAEAQGKTDPAADKTASKSGD